MNDNPAVVIDNGSGVIKAGCAGDEAPKVCFPCVVGRSKSETINNNDKHFLIGQEAVNKRSLVTLEYPIEAGVINNWDCMTKIWHHSYYMELKTDPQDQPVLLTETPKNPKKNREKMIEVFFEEFKVPAFYVYTQGTLALYASGRTSGLVIDSGEGITDIVVVSEGYQTKNATRRMTVAGRDLTQYLQKEIIEEGSVQGSVDFESIRILKETRCYIPMDFAEELKVFQTNPEKQVEIELPDGKMIKLRDAQIKTPECMFQPSLIPQESSSLQKCVYESVQKVELDTRRELLENIVLAGGNTMFEGMQHRLTKELGSFIPSNFKIKIFAPVERKYSVWIGGSVLATLSTFQSSWVQQNEYQEMGPNIVNRKCF